MTNQISSTKSSNLSSILPEPLTATEKNVKIVLNTVHFQYQLIKLISILMLGERGLSIKGVETRNTFIVG